MPDASFLEVIQTNGTWATDALGLWTDGDGNVLLNSGGAVIAYSVSEGFAPAVAGAGQTGKVLITSGWPVVSYPVMKAGEIFSIGDGNPYVVTEDAYGDETGFATLRFVPALRFSPEDGAAIEAVRPVGRFWDFPYPSQFGTAERALASGAASGFDFAIPNGDLWTPERCPVEFLPWLAWAMSVDEWDTVWPEERRREAIASAVALHRRKGTPWAMRRALVIAGYGDATLQERDAPSLYDGMTPHDGSITHVKADEWAEYRVFLVRPITIPQAARVRALLTAYAPARCRLKALDYQEAANLYNATVLNDGTYSHGIS